MTPTVDRKPSTKNIKVKGTALRDLLYQSLSLATYEKKYLVSLFLHTTRNQFKTYESFHSFLVENGIEISEFTLKQWYYEFYPPTKKGAEQHE